MHPQEWRRGRSGGCVHLYVDIANVHLTLFEQHLVLCHVETIG
jgi:hypothetical protein